MEAVSHGGERVVRVAKVDVLAVGIVRAHGEVLGEPPPQSQLQGVVFAVRAIIGIVHLGVAFIRGDGQPGVIRRRRGNTSGGATQRQLVEIRDVLQMAPQVPHIGCVQSHLPRQFSLHAQAPCIQRGDLPVFGQDPKGRYLEGAL